MSSNGAHENCLKNGQGETIISFNKLDKSVQSLIKDAIEARQRAYTPYSHFKVGAAIRSRVDPTRIFTGCNVESCTHTPTICAERVAIGKAVSEGFLEFSEIAVIGDVPEDFCTPCGVCRQFIQEFSSVHDTKIYMSGSKPDQVLVTTIWELLPRSFKPKHLLT